MYLIFYFTIFEAMWSKRVGGGIFTRLRVAQRSDYSRIRVKKKKKENRLSRVWGENRVFGEFQIHCPHVFLEKRFLYRY